MNHQPVDPFSGVTSFPQLGTERLVLREIVWDDLDWYLRHFSLPEVVAGQGFPAPGDEEEARADFERRCLAPFQEHDGVRWGLCLRTVAAGEDRQEGLTPATREPQPCLPLIGSVTVFDVDAEVRSCELGYDLDPAHWGRGLMREAASAVLDFAFDALQINRVEALCLPYNTASRGLLERLGFTLEGIMRDHGLDEHGRLVDDALYALLAREWRAGAG